MNLRPYIILTSASILFGCQNQNPNITKTGKDELKSREVSAPIIKSSMQYQDTIYVPIYSDIYVDQQNQNNLLAATLSIRNTSFLDSLYINKIDYYNTQGQLVRSYIDKTISLNPMASVNYVIERDDVSGGAGANFIVELASRSDKIKPLIQAVMVGEIDSNKGFSFSTDGYSIKNE